MNSAFHPGQRWISDSEPELGLGSLLRLSTRTVTVVFPACGETREYALDNAPLRRVRFLETMTAAILSGHRVVPPYGTAGGSAGGTGANRVLRSDGSTVALPGSAKIAMHPGDVFVIETPGGGGFGVAEP